MVLRKSFYIRWSAGRSPRVHEVNPGRDPSVITYELVQNLEINDSIFGKNPSVDTLHKLSCSVRQSIIPVIVVLHRIIMAVAGFSSVSPVGFSKSDTHLVFGSGFAFPSERLSVSSKGFKSMAALTATPSVGISETFNNSQSSEDSTYHKTILK